jgi:hypothetical protein
MAEEMDPMNTGLEEIEQDLDELTDEKEATDEVKDPTMQQLIREMGYAKTDLIYEAFVTEEVQDFQEGFGIKTMIGAFFVALIMTPASIFLSLTTGQGIGSAAQWSTIILFMEVARRSFTTLTKQEMYVLYYVAAALAGSGPFTGFIFNQYLVNSPAAAGFGIADDIPIWVAPQIGSPAILQRTFVHPDWLPAIILMLMGQVLGRMHFIGTGYLLFKATADVERLPFPLAPIAVQGATALAETTQKKETWRWRLFSIGAMVGLGYGVIYVMVPGITGAIMSKPLQIIPIPFLDLTPNVGYIAPAATLAIATDIGQILSGMVVPFWAVVSNAVESILTNFFLNPYLYKVGILKTWRPGMDFPTTQFSNSVDLWLSVSMGAGLGLAIIGFLIAIRYTLIARKSRATGSAFGAKSPQPGRGDPPMGLSIALFVCASVGYVYISHMLVPEFPLGLLIFYGIIWSPFDSYISARLVGLIGRNIDFPYIRQATYILSGYKGVDIWFAPVPIYDRSGLAQRFKEIELTGTKFTSFYKMELLVIPIDLITSFIFWSFVWKMNPIPSAAYPYAHKMWPFRAMNSLLWATATSKGETWLLDALKWKYIAYGLVGTLGFYGISIAAKVPLLIFYGVIGGFGQLPVNVFPQLLGACINRFYISKVIPPERWRRYAMVLIAGYHAGTGLIGMATISFVFISKAVTQLPY